MQADWSKIYCGYICFFPFYYFKMDRGASFLANKDYNHAAILEKLDDGSSARTVSKFAAPAGDADADGVG